MLDTLNISYKTEVYSPHNSIIIGKKRRVDVVICDNDDNHLMHIECKNQNTTGSAEDKLFRAVSEAERDKQLGIPSIIVFAGHGWSVHNARYAMMNGAIRIEILKDWLGLYFNYNK